MNSDAPLFFVIPRGQQFADLRLRVERGRVVFDPLPLQWLVLYGGGRLDWLECSDGAAHAWAWIDLWYDVHCARGGPPDAVQEMRLSVAQTFH